ncbi:MAG: FAD-binding oxidoreductase [Candidatus Riflebacteria bacterium]|nr:FAD-binding oxidoreductase [Candidatus Riflebacteria bacterium]
MTEIKKIKSVVPNSRKFDFDSKADLESIDRYLSDESKMRGTADAIFFPESTEEVAIILEEARKRMRTVTISGGRTGVAGGAVPNGGWLLSMEKMNKVSRFYLDKVSGEYRVVVQPGIPLSSFRQMILSGRFDFDKTMPPPAADELAQFRKETTRWMFPPDPTEPSAQLGGMVATNASGAKTFRYGPVRNYVKKAKVALAGGGLIDIDRGTCFFESGKDLTLNYDGRKITIPSPSYSIPQIKHACGYYSASKLDLLDLFIGSEGTLGVFTEIELALKIVEGERAEVVAFFNDYASVAKFVDSLRSCQEPGQFLIESIEYMCPKSLEMLENEPEKWGGGLEFPKPQKMAIFVGVRILGRHDDTLGKISQMIGDSGGDTQNACVAISPPDLSRMASLRHQLPEKVNDLISQRRKTNPGLTKLGTDMAVPDSRLEEILNFYTSTLNKAGLEHCIFGHIGNNHLHVNIIPRNTEEYKRGREIYVFFAENVVKMGGSVSAEHGVGKLKKNLLEIQFSKNALEEMKKIKRVFDDQMILGQGNLFA